jgi:hypothetical protein
MAVQIVKSNLNDYYSKPDGDPDRAMLEAAPKFFTQHPLTAKCVFGSGLILELGAILMLLSRRWAVLWGSALLGMHLGIAWIMDIEFWGHVGLLAVLCLLPALGWRRSTDATSGVG